jgi:hypothetical protein
MNKYAAYYLFLCLLTFGMAVYTVVVGSHHIDYGKRISLLEQQKRQLSFKSQQIDQQTSRLLSMSELNQQAQQLGFVPIHHIVRVDTTNVVASR